ncbi:hypothetical protein MNEG_5566 [Monoraphidium neglectum]|uniref:Uncharacterized protein n=1 Tax=Monoraphidium neglectum TaxID=145388 RepID=A0A0D2N9T9_9CHLO|nr:hypothetical protein MNEG_5566 [Monoraphidium neglectum]KIZ02391.1 hypothetical protein MNEG_5566 [Monoraphidium neglectum]|eukprot:XP_013901410.1 hypothetical protein MNEG_5566 [Monoraphidium neglectum]
MACYLGCRGCCAKLRWLIFILATLAAVAFIVAGLVKTVTPNGGDWRALFVCTTKDQSIQDGGVCWQTFWRNAGVPFVVLCIGVAALALSLLTCCCFCCASAPGSRRAKKDQQFIQGDTYDTGAQGDQYAYGAPKPTVAHV